MTAFDVVYVVNDISKIRKLLSSSSQSLSKDHPLMRILRSIMSISITVTDDNKRSVGSIPKKSGMNSTRADATSVWIINRATRFCTLSKGSIRTRLRVAERMIWCHNNIHLKGIREDLGPQRKLWRG